jgi:hypothetical protein
VRTPALLGIVLLVLAAACGGPSADASAPVAGGPSEQARMVCEDEAQEDIALMLGVTPQEVGPPTTTNNTFACRYTYPDGAVDLSVQDLPDGAATTAAYQALATKLGHATDVDLDTAAAKAFTTTGGSVVLRKDDKVMLVDVTPLPAMFGRPPVPKANAALLVMKAILGCWT